MTVLSEYLGGPGLQILDVIEDGHDSARVRVEVTVGDAYATDPTGGPVVTHIWVLAVFADEVQGGELHPQMGEAMGERPILFRATDDKTALSDAVLANAGPVAAPVSRTSSWSASTSPVANASCRSSNTTHGVRCRAARHERAA
jgi:hypothetical protein